MRIPDMPVIEVHMMDSDAAPSGLGEVGVPATAPAVANAVFQATGRRVRHLPIRAEDLAGWTPPATPTPGATAVPTAEPTAAPSEHTVYLPRVLNRRSAKRCHRAAAPVRPAAAVIIRARIAAMRIRIVLALAAAAAGIAWLLAAAVRLSVGAGQARLLAWNDSGLHEWRPATDGIEPATTCARSSWTPAASG
ncbi:MAG: hypothetical protein U0470_10510 [Anaerolineae bacterium]